MHFLIFAGGAGTRLWPLSRSHSPKQFEKLKDNQSTLEMAVDRIRPLGIESLYISTNARYVDLVRTQVPDIDDAHIMSEPARRDLAAAVLLNLLRLKERGVRGTIALLWADHFMRHPEAFQSALLRASELVEREKNRFIFLAEKPRFPNHNLGWIHVGEEIADGAYTFLGWKYRPALDVCEDMFVSGSWFWNPGYFVTDLDFLLSLYRTHQPELYHALADMMQDAARLESEYVSLPAMSFDQAIIEKIELSQAVVLPVDLGWSDPGTLYALKEALHPETSDILCVGNVCELDSTDSFVFNEESHKVVSVIGLDGMIVVNTKDALLVCHKDRVPDIKVLLAKLESEGKQHYL